MSSKPFPECADGCVVVEYLGVGECEAVCPEKFDDTGNPVKAAEAEGRSNESN